MWRHLWELRVDGYLIFDDTVFSKKYSENIKLTRRQYSGNEHKVIRGIGLVNCVYVNPDTHCFWVIDYRIYYPNGDGKTPLHHFLEMLQGVVYCKELAFKTVLMDTW